MKTLIYYVQLIFMIFICIAYIKSDQPKCVSNGCDCYMEGNSTLTLCSPGLLKCFNNQGQNQCKYNDKESICEWDLSNNDFSKCLSENKYCIKTGCALEKCVPFFKADKETCLPPFPAKRACYEYATCKLQNNKCGWEISSAIESCFKSYN